jgi:hypothetical protein
VETIENALHQCSNTPSFMINHPDVSLPAEASCPFQTPCPKNSKHVKPVPC